VEGDLADTAEPALEGVGHALSAVLRRRDPAALPGVSALALR
jgi:hypothetical protein